jgi:P27 family predicted phage terminase small subunit
MSVGRRPKPTALKRAAGNVGHRPLNDKEPKPTGTPTCPKHLDKAAKAEWKRISKELTSLGLLTSVDRAALAAYCQAWSRFITAEEGIARFGLVIKSPKSGFPIQNPFVSISNTALDLMRKFAVEFGLSPASRSRLTTGTAEPTDAFAEFMQTLGADEEVGVAVDPTQ